MKQRSSGPTKKLAPARHADLHCPHSYTSEHGLQLEVDCSACTGAQDINNGNCARGILNILRSGVEPDSIILKRYIHRRYRSESFKSLCELATELSVLNRIVSAQVIPSDKRCLTCSASKEKTAEYLINQLRHDPVAYAKRKRALSDRLKDIASEASCPKGHDCLREALATTIIRYDGGA
ncbi:MAG: hypothetical protein KKE24_01110 [Candidatus Thermoplasmatota archaeon]|nr:hypothetical protein [Candidatus Thermoplasmatota archaeon]